LQLEKIKYYIGSQINYFNKHYIFCKDQDELTVKMVEGRFRKKDKDITGDKKFRKMLKAR
jgi:hypothetical protein